MEKFVFELHRLIKLTALRSSQSGLGDSAHSLAQLLAQLLAQSA
ncbi:hypothetical protein [Coleofasciculus sp. H7-2]